MAGKIYIARADAGIVPNAHTYLVYDVDGDTDTFDDQYIINGGPLPDGQSFYGIVSAEVNLLVQSSVYYKVDTDDDGIIDRDPEDYYNYTELSWSANISAANMWMFMASVAGNIVAANPITYLPGGPNSNSITASILNAAGIDFRNNTPTGASSQQFPGHMGLIDGVGNATYTAFVNTDIGIQETTDFYKGGGNDKITLEYRADINRYAELELIFNENLNNAHFTKVILEGLNYSDVDIEYGDKFKITSGWNPLDDDLVRIDDFETEFLSDNIAFEFEDFYYQSGDNGSNTLDASSITKNVLLEGRDEIDILKGGSWNDTLIGGAGNATLYGGDGTDTVDYSNDAAAGGTNGVEVTLDDNGDGTATDGFGNTDRLYSIENLTLTEYDDDITLDTPSGRTIDTRGGDNDTVTYTTDIVEDHNSGADGEVIIWDQNATAKDTLIGVEDLSYSATTVLPDYDEDANLTSRYSTQIITNDYSAYEGSLVMSGDLWSVYDRNSQPLYSPSTFTLIEVVRKSEVTIKLDNGTQQTTSLGYSAIDVAPAYEYIDFEKIYRDLGYYENSSVKLVGTNNGDTIFLDSGTRGVAGFYAPPVVSIATGSGDDNIIIAEDVGWSVTIEYRGGDDYIFCEGGLGTLYMWEGLRQSEVIISTSGDKVMIDAGTFGVLELDGISTAPNIVWLSETTSEVDGTWGKDSLIARTGETYNGLSGNDYIMGEGDNTMTGGAGNDTIQVGIGGNVVSGNDGDDTFIVASGGVHNDTYYGGEGNDRVVLDGNFSDYTRDGSTFTHLSDGSSYELDGIEEIQFNDGIFDFETQTHTTSVVSTNAAVDDVFDVPMFSEDFSLDILANDSSFVSTILAYQQTEHGTLKLNGEGNGFLYTPDTYYEGTDSFTYSILNGLGNVETATVDINVVLTGPGLGTDGDDILVGTTGTDYMRGLAGNDTLESGGGNGDVMYGGLGLDTYVLDPTTTNAIIQDVYTGDGGDLLPNSLGRLYLNNASITFDSLLANVSISGSDLVISDGANILATINEAVTFGFVILDDGTYVSSSGLYSYARDSSWGWYGETYQPTEGNDTIDFSMGSVVMDLLGGDDSFVGSGVVYGGEGNDIFDGAWADSDDAFYGGAGDDYFYEHFGEDTLDGGDGYDTLWISYSNQGVNIDLSQNKIFNDGVGYSGEIYSIEDVNGTFRSDRIIGSDADFERISTGDGDDVLAGGKGTYDYLYGGIGNDTYIFNAGDGRDTIIDRGGELDVVEFGVGIDQSNIILTQSGNSLVITFDNSEDQLTVYNHYSETYPYPIEKLVFFDGSEISLTGDQTNITGSSFSDALVGTDVADYIDGGAGDDILDGSAGNDTLVGGTGNDTYLFNTGDGVNTILETSGFDVLELGTGITFDDLSFVQNGDDLEIQIASGFIINDFFSGDEGKIVEQVRFDDGTIYDLTTLLNTAPVAQDDIFSGDEDIIITGNVLTNDTDTDDDTLSVFSETITTTNGGTVETSTDGSFTYTPATDFNGTDTFTYEVTDGADTDTGTVTLTVEAVNDAPVANADNISGSEDVVITGNVLADNGNGADSDVDGDILSIVAVNGQISSVGDQITLASGALLTVVKNGQVEYDPNDQFNHLESGEIATDSFQYTVSDGNGSTDTQTTIINIYGVSDTVIIRLGDAPDRLPRDDRYAWINAWSDEKVTITHKMDYADDSETWTDILISGNGGSVLAGGDIYSGDLGVSGVTTSESGAYLQEIDGTEALKFELSETATKAVLNLERFYFDDDGNGNSESVRVQAFDENNTLVKEVIAIADSLSGNSSMALSVETGFKSLVVTSGAYQDDAFLFGSLADATGSSSSGGNVVGNSEFMIEAIEFEFGSTDNEQFISLMGVNDNNIETLVSNVA